LKKYELESFAKSFGLFFLLITSIYLLVIWQNYATKQRALDTRILQEMRIFTFDPVSKDFEVSFVPNDRNNTLLSLHHAPDEVYAFFRIPTMDDTLMRVALPAKRYGERLNAIRYGLLKGAVFFVLLIALISSVLAYYSLQPIRQALRLNKEFMKDILHDVNTPMASIAVNLKLLKKRFGEDVAIDRIGSNVETIAMLRENLHAYLGDRQEEEHSFSLRELLDERLIHFRALYPQLTFENRVADNVVLHTRKHALIRIMDNLIGNAAKYNYRQGSVRIYMEEDTLIIEDTGRGIEHVDKVFQRHYKEGERGMGLGLHIVQSLCHKLGIPIRIESRPKQGTRVYLDCKKVIQK